MELECIVKSESVKSCVTLCDPMDCSPPDSSVCGIFQARILEWVVISFSKGSPWPRDWTRVSYGSYIGKRIFLPLSHLESPLLKAKGWQKWDSFLPMAHWQTFYRISEKKGKGKSTDSWCLPICVVEIFSLGSVSSYWYDFTECWVGKTPT